MDEIRMLAEMLFAVEVLEFHDQNLLHGSHKSRSEWRMARFRQLLAAIDKIKSTGREKNLRETYPAFHISTMTEYNAREELEEVLRGMGVPDSYLEQSEKGKWQA